MSHQTGAAGQAGGEPYSLGRRGASIFLRQDTRMKGPTHKENMHFSHKNVSILELPFAPVLK
jgi:hypothetical protein